ncbi:MAG: exodeoxyribonuclease VII small subunit [Planctomycetes bacterium]|nr:exodeoxyribonuclease VII small subunit [Planctomycetota bacterium]
MSKKNGEEELTFEEALNAAETAGSRLERGDLTLAESLEQYQRGVRALNDCYRILNQAQRRLETLNEELGVVDPSSESAGDVRSPGGSWVSASKDAALKDVIERLGDESKAGE